MKTAKAAARKQGLDIATLTFITGADNRVSFVVTPAEIGANGVIMPKEGTITRRVWALADSIASTCEGGYKAVRLAVIRAAADDFHPATVQTQISRWARYHGLGNRRA
jgi:hypothetical protein